MAASPVDTSSALTADKRATTVTGHVIDISSADSSSSVCVSLTHVQYDLASIVPARFRTEDYATNDTTIVNTIVFFCTV